MKAWVVTDHEGEVHGAFSTAQKAYDCAEKYIMEWVRDFEDKCFALDGLRESFEKWKNTGITWGADDVIYCTPTILD